MGFWQFEDQEIYPHPFTEAETQEYKEPAHTKDDAEKLIMLKMCEMSAAIREEPDWHTKFKDDAFQHKWRQEIVKQRKDLPINLQLTDNMISYILTELQGYFGLRDEMTGVESGPYDRIWRSDTLIPPDLRAALLAAVSPLENAPDAEKGWRPSSDGRILDLVHPSLYPIVYDRSADHTGALITAPEETDEFDSRRFQWMPSDFKIDDNLSASLVSPYINNMHPVDHSALYAVIPKILSKAVPLFERVLSDLSREAITKSGVEGWCIWPECTEPEPEDDLDYDEREEWLDQQPKNWPECEPLYDDGLAYIEHEDRLKGRTIQVIIKLENILLTPDKPEYMGDPNDTWHVEGALNEHIVASFIYYYDWENITESTLSFRNATAEPIMHIKVGPDSYCNAKLYGMDRGDACAQEIGKIVTKGHRAIAFPNIYQHRAAPLKLADPTKPGHCKTLVFFLVDPNCSIPSATTVAPLQKEWIVRAIKDAPEHSLWRKLPMELINMILSFSTAMTRDDAQEYMLELMEEHAQISENVHYNRFCSSFQQSYYR